MTLGHLDPRWEREGTDPLLDVCFDVIIDAMIWFPFMCILWKVCMSTTVCIVVFLKGGVPRAQLKTL